MGNFGKRERLHVGMSCVEPVVHRKKQSTRKIAPQRSVSLAGTQMIDRSWKSLKDFLPVGWHASEKVDGHTKVSWTVLLCVCVCVVLLCHIEMNGGSCVPSTALGQFCSCCIRLGLASNTSSFQSNCIFAETPVFADCKVTK